MKVRFWGVRGSFATPGPLFLRYGGHTTCVEITNDAGQRLLIDLGTGATALARELMAGDFGKGRGFLPILLSHTHLDHIQGLPFFTPFFIKGNSIHILGPEPGDLKLSETLQNQLNGHYSPLYGLENLTAGVTVDPARPGESLPVEGFEVTCDYLQHGAMQVLGFRICADDQVVAFLSDVEYPDTTPTQAAIELAKNADLLIHDAMFSDFEYQSRRGWGHSPVSAALALAEVAGVKKLALFHHSPDATDAEIDALAEEARARTEIEVIAASESESVEL
jgi:phosphoribosyl 1,2-cyclic phosphodiesterase